MDVRKLLYFSSIIPFCHIYWSYIFLHFCYNIASFCSKVSRSIGDAYLKRPEFTIDPSVPRFQLSEPLRRPVLTAEPSIYTRVVREQDKFLIFASDGLWEHLTNQEAAEIVYNYPRAVCWLPLFLTLFTPLVGNTSPFFLHLYARE